MRTNHEKLSPVVLFVYNRPEHTRRTIDALRKNELADQTDLIIFSDAAKNIEEIVFVNEVRDYIETVSGFNSLRIVKRNENYGLAKSIIQGVTEIVNEYGRVIVLEDDIVTSPAFLQFMNQALHFYQNIKEVWHISGWNYPIDPKGLGDTFFWRVMNCWGWATWSDRWVHFEKNPEKLITKWTCKEKYHFDLDGSGVFWNQIEANSTGKINTWAIFWYATIYERAGLCLNPSVSYVENIGHDGSGINCGYANKVSNRKFLSTKKEFYWCAEVMESSLAIRKLKNEINQSMLKKIWNKLCKLTFGI